jgi:hypothetical protein
MCPLNADAFIVKGIPLKSSLSKTGVRQSKAGIKCPCVNHP